MQSFYPQITQIAQIFYTGEFLGRIEFGVWLPISSPHVARVARMRRSTAWSSRNPTQKICVICVICGQKGLNPLALSHSIFGGFILDE
jgi:hypothetical protein